MYGEMTIGSFQDIVNFLIVNCDLNELSRFLDVGNGRGKPSIHVAQDPGVQFSCGVEVESLRSSLGLFCLRDVTFAAMTDKSIGYKCIFKHADATEAITFDPFTHVYIYDVA